MTKPHLLVTTDLSESAAAAIPTATELATRMGAEVTLLTVVTEGAAIPHGAPLAPKLADPSLPERQRDAETAIEAMAGRFPGEVEVTTRVITAPKVVDGILATAKDIGADILIIASRGWSGVRGLLLGSTAETILRTAPMPVLMVPVQRSGKGS